MGKNKTKGATETKTTIKTKKARSTYDGFPPKAFAWRGKKVGSRPHSSCKQIILSSTASPQLTERAWSGRKRERALRPGTRIHLGRGGQSANSVKLYKISSWEPGKKHQSTCRAS